MIGWNYNGSSWFLCDVNSLWFCPKSGDSHPVAVFKGKQRSTCRNRPSIPNLLQGGMWKTTWMNSDGLSLFNMLSQIVFSKSWSVGYYPGAAAIYCCRRSNLRRWLDKKKVGPIFSAWKSVQSQRRVDHQPLFSRLRPKPRRRAKCPEVSTPSTNPWQSEIVFVWNRGVGPIFIAI